MLGDNLKKISDDAKAELKNISDKADSQKYLEEEKIFIIRILPVLDEAAEKGMSSVSFQITASTCDDDIVKWIQNNITQVEHICKRNNIKSKIFYAYIDHRYYNIKTHGKYYGEWGDDESYKNLYSSNGYENSPKYRIYSGMTFSW